jgi:hypothetical protein
MIQRIKSGLAAGANPDVLNEQLSALLAHDPNDENDDDDEELLDADDISDALGIALELVKQVCTLFAKMDHVSFVYADQAVMSGYCISYADVYRDWRRVTLCAPICSHLLGLTCSLSRTSLVPQKGV